MIDWTRVALNALWILGLSIVLAAFSHHQGLATGKPVRLRAIWPQRSWQIPFSAGMLLTCVGFAYGLSDRWWQTAIWTALALVFAVRLGKTARSGRGIT
jgi:hypothetical protein